MARLEEHASIEASQGAERAARTAFLVQKSTDYSRQSKQLEEAIQANGYDESLTHSAIAKVAKVTPQLPEISVRAFVGLPRPPASTCFSIRNFRPPILLFSFCLGGVGGEGGSSTQILGVRRASCAFLKDWLMNITTIPVPSFFLFFSCEELAFQQSALSCHPLGFYRSTTNSYRQRTLCDVKSNLIRIFPRTFHSPASNLRRHVG